MRRADRLFLIIHTLRGRRAVTARRLAETLRVSARTVYRDVADLQLSGRSDVPPLMFTKAELEALVVGARFTEAFAGERLAAAARHALVKVEAVLPEDLRRRAERSRVLVPAARRAAARADLDALHEAIESRHLVRFAYARPDGAASQRDVEPVCLAFWGRVWTLGAWCRLRQDFRSFRLDRMAGMHVLEETYPDDPARGLRAFLASVGANPDAEV